MNANSYFSLSKTLFLLFFEGFLVISEFNSEIARVMIQRELQRKLRSAIKNIPAIGLTGPRQSGKTTLVKQTFPDYHYINFERKDLQTWASQDPIGFLAHLESPHVIIDEAQKVPELLSYLQVVIDEDKHRKFILTGSQNFLLLEKIGQTLAGRILLFDLLPLSLRELRSAQVDHPIPLPYILKGGYPRLYDSALQPQEWMSTYIQTYIERDVRQIVNIKDLKKFQTFLSLCAAYAGQILNYSHFSNELGVSDKTIRHWISILEASYVVYTLSPYYRNIGKRLTKSPKLYFYDTGVACSLLGIAQENQLLTYYQYGGLFENFAINEIMKSFTNQGKRPNLHFWRQSDGTEIDLLVHKDNTIIPIEIKASQTMNPSFFTPINKVRTLLHSHGITPGYVVYGGNTSAGNMISWKNPVRF